MTQTASGLIEAAKIARREGRLRDALFDVQNAVALSRKSNEQLGLITSIKALGHIEADLGNHEASASAYQEADDLSRRTGDPVLMAHSVRHLGDALSRLGQTQMAERCYVEAIAHYRANAGSSKADHANALTKFARLLDSTDRPGEATSLWIQALELYTVANVPAGVAECSARLHA